FGLSSRLKKERSLTTDLRPRRSKFTASHWCVSRDLRLGEKDGAICACPSRTREKPFPTLFPWGSRARVQHRDCCRLSTPIGGRRRRTKGSKPKQPLFLLLPGAALAR